MSSYDDYDDTWHDERNTNDCYEDVEEYDTNGYDANAGDYQPQDDYVDDYTADESYSDMTFGREPASSESSNSRPSTHSLFTGEPSFHDAIHGGAPFTGRSSTDGTHTNNSPAYDSSVSPWRGNGPYISGDDKKSAPSDTSSTTRYTPSTSTTSPQPTSNPAYRKPYTITSHGTNSQGSHWCNRDYGPNVPNKNSYHYSNLDGSYYYSNPNGE